MLAPGALAVLQAISSYGSSMRIIEQNLAQAAQLAASEEVNVIAASREILTSLGGEITPMQDVTLVIRRKNGRTQNVTLTLRVDTAIEAEYLRHGGILPYVLREIIAQAA